MFASRKPERTGPPEDSIAALYRAHAPWVVAFLARRFGREVAEDLAQETFLRLAATHPADWRSPKAFLARVALNVALDHVRRERAHKRPRLVSDLGVPEASTPPDQDETVFHREVVAKLPRNLRDVYCLSRFAGMTYRGGGKPETVGELDGGDPRAGGQFPAVQLLAQMGDDDEEGFGLGLGHEGSAGVGRAQNRQCGAPA